MLPPPGLPSSSPSYDFTSAACKSRNSQCSEEVGKMEAKERVLYSAVGSSTSQQPDHCVGQRASRPSCLFPGGCFPACFLHDQRGNLNSQLNKWSTESVVLKRWEDSFREDDDPIVSLRVAFANYHRRCLTERSSPWRGAGGRRPFALLSPSPSTAHLDRSPPTWIAAS